MNDINIFTYSEVLDYVQNTPQVWHWKSTNSSHTWSKEFTWTNSYWEAINLARYGWDAWIKQLKDIDLISVNGSFDTEYDMQGGAVDVGRFIGWHQDCMINFIDKIERDKPQITMYIPIGYSCGNKVENIQSYLKDAMKIMVEKLQTHDVRVYWYMLSSHDGWNKLFCNIILKDFWQQVVLNNFAFAFHPSFFRRILFRLLETKDYLGYWYGTPKSNIENTLRGNGLLEKWETWLFPDVDEVKDRCRKEKIRIIKW